MKGATCKTEFQTNLIIIINLEKVKLLKKQYEDDKFLEEKDKILKGLEKVVEKLIEFKKSKNSELVIWRDKKIVRIKPE